MRIQVLEGQHSVQGGTVSMSETISSIMELLQVLKENNLIVETASSSTPIVLVEEKCDGEEEIMKESEAFRVFDEIEKVEQKIERKKKTLKMGSEGDDVRAMQVCFCHIKQKKNITKRGYYHLLLSLIPLKIFIF